MYISYELYYRPCKVHESLINDSNRIILYKNFVLIERLINGHDERYQYKEVILKMMYVSNEPFTSGVFDFESLSCIVKGGYSGKKNLCKVKITIKFYVK